MQGEEECRQGQQRHEGQVELARDSNEVCNSWNKKQGKFADVAPGKPCPTGRAHACQKYLSGSHRSAECPQSDQVQRSPLLVLQGDGAASHSCPNAEEDNIAVESHAHGSLPVREERPFPPKVGLSPAVEEAAEGATSWEVFRGRRLSRFVHWLAGTARFGVGEAVVAEASNHGLRAEHISLDRGSDGVDFAADEPAESHLAWARGHKVDGAHAGFPCSTFSFLWFREQPGMPGPDRDLEHMRASLPTRRRSRRRRMWAGCWRLGRLPSWTPSGAAPGRGRYRR